MTLLDPQPNHHPGQALLSTAGERKSWLWPKHRKLEQPRAWLFPLHPITTPEMRQRSERPRRVHPKPQVGPFCSCWSDSQDRGQCPYYSGLTAKSFLKYSFFKSRGRLSG